MASKKNAKDSFAKARQGYNTGNVTHSELMEEAQRTGRPVIKIGGADSFSSSPKGKPSILSRVLGPRFQAGGDRRLESDHRLGHFLLAKEDQRNAAPARSIAPSPWAAAHDVPYFVSSAEHAQIEQKRAA